MHFICFLDLPPKIDIKTRILEKSHYANCSDAHLINSCDILTRKLVCYGDVHQSSYCLVLEIWVWSMLSE